jgi:two-component system phosphate regulon sensor histidine kinase PhoR
MINSNSLKKKFTFFCIALVLLSMLLSGVYLLNVLSSYFSDNFREKLLVEARLIREMVGRELDVQQPSSSTMAELAGRLGNVTSTRITIIDADGVVLGDSQEEPSLMDNYLNRPEIQQVISDEVGTIEKKNVILSNEMMFLALPVKKDGEIRGFVRLSLPTTEITTILSRLWFLLITALLLAIVLAALLGQKLAQRLTKPIKEMTFAAQKISAGDFSVRTYTTSQDEIAVLGQALNQMAQQLKETIDAVSTEKSKLESVLANMVSGVIFLGQDGRVDLVNPAAGQILGINPILSGGRQHVGIIRNYQLSQLIATALETGKVVKEEILILVPLEKNVQVNITPITGRANSNLGAVVVLHDITDFRELERMRKDFVANVSHELKTPVTSLQGYAETLLDGALDDTKVAREFVNIMLTESERLSILINDLLELSKIESTANSVMWQEIDIDVLICFLKNKFKPQVEELQIKLEFTKPEYPLIAIGDNGMIEQVLTNLIDNAVKYSPVGGKVTMAVSEQAEGILFEVIDTGLGIPEQELKRIFERFYRVDKGRSRKLGGTGLGLAIVKHILETLGSQIKVESTLGRGSKFYFFLPKKKINNNNKI